MLVVDDINVMQILQGVCLVWKWCWVVKLTL